MNLFRKFLAPASLEEDEYLFTLDHDGGLVVSLDALVDSGTLEEQLMGVRLLAELKRKRQQGASIQFSGERAA